jgi:hypothetical protein
LYRFQAKALRSLWFASRAYVKMLWDEDMNCLEASQLRNKYKMSFDPDENRRRLRLIGQMYDLFASDREVMVDINWEGRERPWYSTIAAPGLRGSYSWTGDITVRDDDPTRTLLHEAGHAIAEYIGLGAFEIEETYVDELDFDLTDRLEAGFIDFETVDEFSFWMLGVINGQ